ERAGRGGLQRSQQGTPQAQAHAVVLQLHGSVSIIAGSCRRATRGTAATSHPAALALAALAFHAALVGRPIAFGLLVRAAAAFVVGLALLGVHEAVPVRVDLVEHPGLVGMRGVELGARDLAILVRVHGGDAALAFLRLVGAAGSLP